MPRTTRSTQFIYSSCRLDWLQVQRTAGSAFTHNIRFFHNAHIVHRSAFIDPSDSSDLAFVVRSYPSTSIIGLLGYGHRVIGSVRDSGTRSCKLEAGPRGTEVYITQCIGTELSIY